MPRYASPLISTTVAGQWDRGEINHIVQTSAGVLYVIFVATDSDLYFTKSLDDGITWSRPVLIFTGTCVGVAVWYDRWSNIAAGLIHCAYNESGGSDTLYRTINTESSDALSTQTTIFAGSSVAAGAHLAITRAVGGNVYCKSAIDAGTEGGFYRLPNANVPNGAWDAARTVDEALATNDEMILHPDFDAADTQDIMAFFWDSSGSEISRKLYDDSANSWAETSIATSMTKIANATSGPHMSAAVDIANTRSILVAWSNVDSANADLRCWAVQASSITETSANVVLNSTDDQGACAIAIDTAKSHWYVFFAGTAAGSETWGTSVHVYYKASTDGGATWSPETALTTNAQQAIPLVKSMFCTPNFTGRWCLAFVDDTTIDRLCAVVPITQPVATWGIGV